MADTVTCADCGGPLLAGDGWGEELCPHCLMRMALRESAEDGFRFEEPGSATTLEAPATELSKGCILGNRYGIRALLGRGGMGEVWRALDLKLRVDVALKTVRPDLRSRESVIEILRREVRAAREVASPNVCRVYDLEDLEGHELVSMEFVEGQTLLDVLRERGPLSLQEAREVASQLLAGLEAIHHAGLAHRDLKPENIMITPANRVVLMDFGIAKNLGEGRSGTISGTPAYMAPEQSRGDVVDARADVFSAGIVLAEMLVPRVGDHGEVRSLLWRSVRREPPQLPDSPWRSVLERAVAREPAQRYATAAALARALEETALGVEGAEDVEPYPGLVAFSEEDHDYFFCRELEVETLWRAVRRCHMTALIGPSGAGKTSLLRAGLLAAVQPGWSSAICTPGESPVTNLRRALAAKLSDDSDAIRALVDVDDPGAVVSAASRWRQQSRHTLLVVDQLEELFTLSPPEVQLEFAGLLGRLALEADVRVLLSLRDDFLVHCQTYEALAPVFSGLTVLGPPTSAALRRALVQPALKCGYRFEDDALVDEIVEEVTGQRGALPMVAFCAEQMWRRRDRERGLLTREAFEVIGGVSGALAQHAELTLERIGTDRVPVVRELFRNLVTSRGTRTVRRRDDLLSVFGDGLKNREAAAQVLDALVDARLLTSYGRDGADDDDTTQHVEIVHESLLTSWPRLARWQAQDVEGARLRDDIRQAARRWQERGRSDDLLWTGSAYREYQLWRERYAGRLSQLEEEYCLAMQRLATRRRRRQRMAFTLSFITVATVAVVLGAMLRISLLQTRRAEASKLVTLGHNSLDEERTEALAFAIAALELADSSEARRLAQRALWAGPPATVLPRLDHPFEVVFAPDGRSLAVSCKGASAGLVLVFDQGGGVPADLRPFDTEGIVEPLRFSADSKLLVGSLEQRPGEVRIWRTGASAVERSLRVPDVERVGGFFEPRGEAVVTVSGHAIDEGSASADRTVRILVHRWPPSTEQGELVGVVEGTALPFPFPDLDRGLLPVGRGDVVELHRLDRLGTEPGRVVARHPEGFGAHSRPAFDPSNRRVALWDAGGNLCTWPIDGDGGEPDFCFEVPDKAFSAAFAHDGSHLALATYSKGALLWDLDGPAGAEPLRFGREGQPTFSAAFTPDGRWLATAHRDRAVLWPLSDGYARTLKGHVGGVSGLAFSPDGTRLYSQGRNDGTILAWDIEAGAGSDPEVVLRDEKAWGWTMSADPWGRFLIAATNTEVWKIPLDGSPLTVLEESTNGLPAEGGFDPAGRLLAMKPYSDAGGSVVVVHDLEDGRRWEIDGPGDGDVGSWGFDPAGRLLVARGGVLSRWHPDSGTTEVLVDQGVAGALALPDGRHVLIVVRGKGRVILDLEDGSRTVVPRAYQRFSSPPYPLIFDSTGSIVMTGNPTTGEIRVGRAFEEPHQIFADVGGFEKLRMSPDGRWIAVTHDDGTIRLLPVPDLERRPMHTLPVAELVTRLEKLTNLRAVIDDSSHTGYSVEPDPAAYHGWAERPF